MNSKLIKIITIVLATIAFISTVYASGDNDVDQKTAIEQETVQSTTTEQDTEQDTPNEREIEQGIFKTPDDLIHAYIDIFRKEDYQRFEQIFKDAVSIGRDIELEENFNPDGMIPLHVAEKTLVITGKDQNEKSDGRLSHSKIIRQKSKIEELFGENAFDNVEYSIVPTAFPFVATKTIDRRTNEVLSPEESKKRSKEFWNGVFAQEGIPESDYRDFPDNIPDIGIEKAELLSSIEFKYKDNDPIVTMFEPLCEAYRVLLKFNSKESADSGEYNFGFIIIKENDIWTLYVGIEYSTPVELPEYDI